MDIQFGYIVDVKLYMFKCVEQCSGCPTHLITEHIIIWNYSQSSSFFFVSNYKKYKNSYMTVSWC